MDRRYPHLHHVALCHPPRVQSEEGFGGSSFVPRGRLVGLVDGCTGLGLVPPIGVGRGEKGTNGETGGGSRVVEEKCRIRLQGGLRSGGL